jgi:hypothetical protein
MLREPLDEPLQRFAVETNVPSSAKVLREQLTWHWQQSSWPDAGLHTGTRYEGTRYDIPRIKVVINECRRATGVRR